MTDQTINTYNLYHQVYDDETTEFWENFPTSTVDAFIKDLPGKKVLNLGSGACRDSVILRDRGLDVTCLDASSEMIKRAEKLGFEAIHSDFRKMKLNEDSFDGVWAYTSLLHVSTKEMKQILKQIHSTLKQNGVFLIGMIEGSGHKNVESSSMPNTKRYFEYYTSNELKSTVENVDFRFVYEERYKPHNNVYISQVYLKDLFVN